MKGKIIFQLGVGLFGLAIGFTQRELRAEDFTETIPVYGIVKPGEMTTLLAVNHGMVAHFLKSTGDSVLQGQVVLTVIERETTRSYRTTIKGQVAKVHVTRGAAVTPGMPLVTVINPKSKIIEVSLSPEEASRVQLGSQVYRRGQEQGFGKVKKMSPLVDPDTGAVVSFIQPQKAVTELIGNILPLEVASRRITGCKVVPIQEVDEFVGKYKVEATSRGKICLLPKET